jgi:hypothetical protein
MDCHGRLLLSAELRQKVPMEDTMVRLSYLWDHIEVITEEQ